jgi:hypothetical protein
MLDGAQSGDVAGDRNIPWQIGKHHLNGLIPNKPGVAFGRQRIRAENAMLPEQPEIA